MEDHREVVLLSAVRTPIGKYGGGLASVPPRGLAAAVVREAVSRAAVAPADIGHAVFGQVIHTEVRDMYLSRVQCRVVKPCCLEVNNVVAISGLRSGAVGAGGGWSGRARQGVPAAAGFGEEAEAGPLGELGEQVRGFYAEPAREFAAGPVLAGLAGHDAGDLVSSAARAGRAGTGRLVRAAGARGRGGPGAGPGW